MSEKRSPESVLTECYVTNVLYAAIETASAVAKAAGDVKWFTTTKIFKKYDEELKEIMGSPSKVYVDEFSFETLRHFGYHV